MFCSQCGKEIWDLANFCLFCGARVESAAPRPLPDEHAAAEAEPSLTQPAAIETEPAPTQPAAPQPPPPPAPLDAIDSVRAAAAIFKDPRWLEKMLIGCLVIIIPFIGVLVILPGYGLTVVNRVARGEEHPLPDWNIGECLNKGILFFIYGFSLFLGASMLLGAVRPALSSLRLLDNLYGVFALSAMCALWVYMLAAFAFAGAENNPGAVFHFGRILDAVIDHPAPLLTALLLNIASVFFAFSGVIGLYVCVVFTIALSAVFMSHIAGQFYRVAHTAAQAGNTPAPMTANPAVL